MLCVYPEVLKIVLDKQPDLAKTTFKLKYGEGWLLQNILSAFLIYYFSSPSSFISIDDKINSSIKYLAKQVDLDQEFDFPLGKVNRSLKLLHYLAYEYAAFSLNKDKIQGIIGELKNNATYNSNTECTIDRTTYTPITFLEKLRDKYQQPIAKDIIDDYKKIITKK